MALALLGFVAGASMMWVASILIAVLAVAMVALLMVKRWGRWRLKAGVAVAALGLSLGAWSSTHSALEARPDVQAAAKGIRDQQEEADRVRREAEHRRKERAAALRDVRQAAETFSAAAERLPDEQMALYRSLNEKLSHAEKIGVNGDDLAPFRDAVKQLDTAIEVIRATDRMKPEAPRAPEEPAKYEKPDRRALGQVWRLSGTYRGGLDTGGIVLSRGDDYFVVRDAERPTYSRVSGYVQTVDWTELNIAGGRLATVVQLSDRQAFRESERAYREEVREGRAKYQAELKKYRQTMRTLRQRTKEYEAQLEQHTAKRGELLKARNEAISRAQEALR